MELQEQIQYNMRFPRSTNYDATYNAKYAKFPNVKMYHIKANPSTKYKLSTSEPISTTTPTARYDLNKLLLDSGVSMTGDQLKDALSLQSQVTKSRRGITPTGYRELKYIIDRFNNLTGGMLYSPGTSPGNTEDIVNKLQYFIKYYTY